MSPEESNVPNSILATMVVPSVEGGSDTVSILKRVVAIGQGPQNDVVLDDDTVSTHHARLEFADGGWKLTDLDSRNGTHVDGVKLAAGIPTPLNGPVQVTFGGLKAAFAPRRTQIRNPPPARMKDRPKRFPWQNAALFGCPSGCSC